MSAPAEYALEACRSYDHWKREIDRLTGEIGECFCPNEPGPHREDAPHPADWAVFNEYQNQKSCFAAAKEEALPSRPEDGPRRRNLGQIRSAVADCPRCTRLCDLIEARRHARQRWGVAKRQVRAAARRAP